MNDTDALTDEVVGRFADTPDARLKEIMTALVRHLHAFAREVRLTEDEWFRGIDFLTRTGQACDAKRQEFILLSDVLGLGLLAIVVTLFFKQGLWGYAQQRWGWTLFPTQRRLVAPQNGVLTSRNPP